MSGVSLVLLFCRATNTVVQSNASLVLLLWDSRYIDQEQCVVSHTCLGLLIRWSRNYRKDRTTVMIIAFDYSNYLFQSFLSDNTDREIPVFTTGHPH